MKEFFENNWWIFPAIILFFGLFFTVNQGFIGVITMFGKYRRIARPGLNLKIPLLDSKPVSRARVPGGNI
jgi:regulator of protease activity HflC (stomatin/prohibitin superfamily)